MRLACTVNSGAFACLANVSRRVMAQTNPEVRALLHPCLGPRQALASGVVWLAYKLLSLNTGQVRPSWPPRMTPRSPRPCNLGGGRSGHLATGNSVEAFGLQAFSRHRTWPLMCRTATQTFRVRPRLAPAFLLTQTCCPLFLTVWLLATQSTPKRPVEPSGTRLC